MLEGSLIPGGFPMCEVRVLELDKKDYILSVENTMVTIRK